MAKSGPVKGGPGANGFNHPKNKEARKIRDASILRDLAAKVPVHEIAEKYELDKRRIYQIRKAALEEVGQRSAETIMGELLLELEVMKQEMHKHGGVGDYKKIGALLEIIEKQAKLQGLYLNERKMAEAAQVSAAAQAAQAQNLLEVINRVVGGLGLTAEQKSMVPGLVREAIVAMGLVEKPKELS